MTKYNTTCSPAIAEPTMGNYVGAVYKETRPHEAQTSNLTNAKGGLLLDYLRVRFEDVPGWRTRLQEWLGPMERRDTGWRGWYSESAIVLGSGIVAWCRDPDMAKRQGVLVDLPGKACAALGDRLIPFFEYAVEHGHVTRADYALDDRTGQVRLSRIRRAVGQNRVVSLWRNRPTFIGDICQDENLGWTVYFGSRSSETMLRIYNKAAEQGVKGPWVRIELETKGDFAHALAEAYFENGSQEVLLQLNRRIRFVDAVPGDSNRRRWPVSAWWASVIGTVERGKSLQAGKEAKATTVELMEEQLERQYGPIIRVLLEAADGDLSVFAEIAERSESRVRPEQWAALERFRQRRE